MFVIFPILINYMKKQLCHGFGDVTWTWMTLLYMIILHVKMSASYLTFQIIIIILQKTCSVFTFW